MAVKTRDRILATSLTLFNEEGEPNVTTVDIAHEMDISPGNLYYHFKGKEAIIDSLYASFDEEISAILQAPLEKSVSVQDSWFYLYVVFEQIYHYRFLYQNLTDILQRYDNISRRFRRLLELKRRTAQAVLDELVEHEVLALSTEDIEPLTEAITMTLTYWLTHRQLTEQNSSEVAMFHDGVFQIVHLITPFLTDDYQHIYREARVLYQAAMAQLEQ